MDSMKDAQFFTIFRAYLIGRRHDRQECLIELERYFTLDYALIKCATAIEAMAIADERHQDVMEERQRQLEFARI